MGRKGEEGEWSSGICVANSPWHACGGKSKQHACGWCEMRVIKEHTDTHAERAESGTVLERTHKQTGRKKESTCLNRRCALEGMEPQKGGKQAAACQHGKACQHSEQPVSSLQSQLCNTLSQPSQARPSRLGDLAAASRCCHRGWLRIKGLTGGWRPERKAHTSPYMA